jgi:hypothetical protein
MYNAIHKYRTRYNYNICLPIVSLSQFNKKAYFSEIKIFNHHPEYIKCLSNDRKYFTTTVTRFLHLHSFTRLKKILNIRKIKKYK